MYPLGILLTFVVITPSLTSFSAFKIVFLDIFLLLPEPPPFLFPTEEEEEAEEAEEEEEDDEEEE